MQHAGACICVGGEMAVEAGRVALSVGGPHRHHYRARWKALRNNLRVLLSNNHLYMRNVKWNALERDA